MNRLTLVLLPALPRNARKIKPVQSSVLAPSRYLIVWQEVLTMLAQIRRATLLWSTTNANIQLLMEQERADYCSGNSRNGSPS